MIYGRGGKLMKKRKKSIGVAVVLNLLLTLTGCSKNQQVIFDAGMKLQNVTSMQTHTTMNLKLSGSGFEPTDQQNVDMATVYLNNAKLELDAKNVTNKEKTVSKAQVDMNLSLQGMSINVPVWVDSDLTGDTPKVSEIIKLPLIATGSLPTQFAGKEYMVLNPYDMTNSESNNINMNELMKFSKSFNAAEVAFLNSYSKRFNPRINVVSSGSQSVQTKDGFQKAQIYKINLNDAQLKEFIRYTVNNFAQDKEAMEFVKEFMGSILEVSQVPDKVKTTSDFNLAFEEFNANKPQFLAEFNTIMDQLDAVTFLGNKGLELKYAISKGYCVQKSGTINLKIDVAQMNQLMNTLNKEQNTAVAPDAKGILNLQINFNTDISGINRPLEIQIPEVNSNNSFNYLDLVKSQLRN